MLEDDEVKGNWNSLNFGAIIYDSRIGRWLSVDLFQANMPYFSPYLFSNESPIIFRDLDGKVGTLYIQILNNDKGKPVLSKAVVDNLVKDMSKM